MVKSIIIMIIIYSKAKGQLLAGDQSIYLWINISQSNMIYVNAFSFLEVDRLPKRIPMNIQNRGDNVSDEGKSEGVSW